GCLSCLPQSHLGGTTQNAGLACASDRTVRQDAIDPPLNLPNRVAFTSFANTSFLIASASHFRGLPALLSGIARLCFSRWELFSLLERLQALYCAVIFSFCAKPRPTRETGTARARATLRRDWP